MNEKKKPSVTLEILQAPTLLEFVPIFFGRKKGGEANFVVKVPMPSEEGTWKNCALSVFVKRLEHGPVYDGYHSTNWLFGGRISSSYRDLQVKGTLEYLYQDLIGGEIHVRQAVQRLLLLGKL